MRHYYVLFSGGIDSTLALLKLAQQGQHSRFTPLFFDYGQKAAEKEKDAIRELIPLLRERLKNKRVDIEACRIIDAGDLFAWSKSSILRGRSDTGDADVENRNMVLIGLAVSVIMADRKCDKTKARGRSLVVGFKSEYYDTKRSFAVRMSAVTSRDHFWVSIVTPLVSTDYPVGWHSLAKQFRNEDLRDLLSRTWSCYCPTRAGRPCGQCSSCRSRAKLTAESETRARMKQ